MEIHGELPPAKNRRGGVGWWMDLDGVWRPPQEWPEDTPPVDGWRRHEDGSWHPPETERTWIRTSSLEGAPTPVAVGSAHEPEKAAEPKRSRQAESDRRAILSVLGAVLAAVFLIGGALLVITQASASGDVEPEVAAEVIYGTQTDAARIALLQQAAALAPGAAEQQLTELVVRAPEDEPTPVVVDPGAWVAPALGCLDISEEALIAESLTPITFADELECVVDGGNWNDRYLSSTITRAIDADVQPLVPLNDVFVSGGQDWDESTRFSYVSELDHPATLQVVLEDGGHNPRGASPAEWRPSDAAVWCAYAVDWVTVKHRWELSVSPAEVVALTEMLSTCSEPTSQGADPFTVLIDPIAEPTINIIDG